MTRVNWQEVAERLLHPLQVELLDLIAAHGPVSPVKLAEQTQQPLGNVAYHVRKLAGAGLLEGVRTEPRRGAVEHYYDLTTIGRKKR